MALTLLGKKLGMTRVFGEGGAAVPVTVIELGPCVVTQIRTQETDAWLDVLHDLWGDTWVPTVPLADEASGSDAQVVALADEQLRVLAAAEDNPRAIVTGGAGTGKTLFARELCLRAAAKGQRVLYLCFTEPLGKAVDRGFASARARGADVRAMPIRRYAAELLARAGVAEGAQAASDGGGPTGEPAFWAQVSLAAACDALPPVAERPDLIVVDEAQDLETGDWDLIGELAGARRLWMLIDPRQAYWQDRAIPAALATGAVRLNLQTQLRNPGPIATFAERYGSPAAPTGAIGAVTAGSTPPETTDDPSAPRRVRIIRSPVV